MAVRTPISYYKLDGNSNDSVGTNNGTDTAITYSSANGRIIQGAGFNGTNSIITIPTATNLNFGTGDFTVCLWYKGNSAAINQERGIITKAATFYSSPGWFIEESSWSAGTGNYNILAGITNNPTFSPLGSPNFLNGTWVHIAFQRVGTLISLFVNGALFSSGTNANNATTVSNATNLVIGKTAWTLFNHGPVDEVGLWDVALTTNEIQQVMTKQYPFINSKFLTLL